MTMENMNIALSESLNDFAQERVEEGAFASISEYVQKLIEADRERCTKQMLEAEVLKGLRSGESVPVTDEDWAQLRDDLRNRNRSKA
jgi:putative addiction module CopG family antidote